MAGASRPSFLGNFFAADQRGLTQIKKQSRPGAEGAENQVCLGALGIGGDVASIVAIPPNSFFIRRSRFLCHNAFALWRFLSVRDAGQIALRATAFRSPRIFDCAMFFQREFPTSADDDLSGHSYAQRTLKTRGSYERNVFEDNLC